MNGLRNLNLPRGFRAALICLVLTAAFVSGGFAQADRSAQAKTLTDEATRLLGERTAEAYRAALDKFSQAEKIYAKDKKPTEQAETLFFIGFTLNAAGQSEKALNAFSESLHIAEQTVGGIATDAPDALKQIQRLMYLAAAVHNAVGGIYAAAPGGGAKAVENFVEAAEFFGEMGLQKERLGVLMNIGGVYENLGERIKAIDSYKQAFAVAKTLGDKPEQAFLTNYIGRIYYDLQEHRQALEYFNLALPLRRELKDRTGEGQTLGNLGTVYMALGEHQKALEFLMQSLPIRREVGEKAGEAINLNNLGMVYLNLGENQKALDYFTQAAPVFKSLGDASGEATTLSNIALIYDRLGTTEKSLDLFNRILLVRRQLGDKTGEAVALNNLGSIYIKQGEWAKALDNFTQSAAIAEKIGDRAGEAAATVNLGVIHFELGRLDKNASPVRQAVTDFQKSLTLYKAVGDASGEAAALGKLMNCFDRLDRLREKNDAGSIHFAVAFGKTAVNKYQNLRRGITGLDKKTQKTYLAQIEEIYRQLAGILIRAKRLPEAQQVLNSFKDEQFFDYDAAIVKQITPLALTPLEAEFIRAYEENGSQIGKIAQQLKEFKARTNEAEMTPSETEQRKKLDAEFMRAAINFSIVIANGELDFSDENRGGDKTPEIADVPLMQAALRRTEEQTKQPAAAVYQLLGDESLHLLIVTPATVKAISVPAERGAVQKRALEFWSLLQSDKYDPNIIGRELYDLIFKPLENELPKNTKTILWSLDGNLRYVPMAALYDGKQYLVERFNHVNFTRADGGRMTAPPTGGWQGTGLGASKMRSVALSGEKFNFSALPGVETELREIFKIGGAGGAGVVSGEVLSDEKFSRAAMIAALERRRPLVHIASHFSFRPNDENRSFLLLGDGTALTLAEMKNRTNLFAGVQLLTLSACNTAAQQADAAGGEIDGFAELAQRLGANAVMATLWSVADSSTPWLMREFYDLKLNKNQTKAEALRQAQISLLTGRAQTAPQAATRSNSSPITVVVSKTPPAKKTSQTETRSDLIYLIEQDAPPFVADESKPFAHPFYWSPFILFGNWQ